MEELVEAIVIGLLVGAVVGGIPAITGAVKGKIGLAIGGFFACLVGAMILGLIGAIPICAVFMWLIFKN